MDQGGREELGKFDVARLVSVHLFPVFLSFCSLFFVVLAGGLALFFSSLRLVFKLYFSLIQ